MTCKGTILEAVRITPKHFSFGRIPRKGDPQSKKVMLTRGDAGPLTPKLLGDTPSGIKAKLREIEPGQRYELEVTLIPPFTTNRVSTNLRLETGVPEAPAASVRVFASVIPRVTAQPTTIRFPQERDSDWQQTLHLVWGDDVPPQILKVTIDNPKLSVCIEEKDDRQVIVLQADPDYVVRPTRQYITLITDDLEEPESKMPITISGKTRAARTAQKIPRTRRGQEKKIERLKLKPAAARRTGTTTKPRATTRE